jgi:hypothetical protein
MAALVADVGCVHQHSAVPFPDGIADGRWTYVARMAAGDSSVGELSIAQHRRTLAGVVHVPGSPDSSTNVIIHTEGSRIWFAAPTDAVGIPGHTDRFFTVVATVQPDRELVGRWYREDGRSGEWVARARQ